MSQYFFRHLRNALASLGELSRQPLATIMTVAVIGIALVLPASLLIGVHNAQRFAGGWDDIRDFSVYMKPGTKLDTVRHLGDELSGRRRLIENVRLIAADTAVKAFREDAAFAEVMNALEDNPLPHTLVVRPIAAATADDLDALKTELAGRDDVDLVQLDTKWLERLAAILDVLRRTVWIATAVLLVAVIAIIGNTIRLDIQNRRQEIEVSKLLGASDAFVRRPFLYLGFWYGLFGGVFALLLLGAGALVLAGPLQRVMLLYGSAFGGIAVPLPALGLVLAGGLAAGSAGAWVAVGRHLSAIEPRV
jgi:cell division transport system permease protein